MAPLTMTSPIIRLAQCMKDVASFLENACPHIEDKRVDAEESVKDSLKCLLADAEDILEKSHSPAHNLDVMEDIEGKESSKDILKIRSRFDDIDVRRKTLRLIKDNGYRRAKTPIRPLSGPVLNEPIIYGRDGDKKHLLDLLKNNKSKNLYVGEVIGLIGIGGIGKTTLARVLYNDEEIKNYFNYRAWVTVSRTFDVETYDVVQITKDILESFTGKSSDLTQLGTIQEELQKLLQEKKFFLVLDDMWDEVISESLKFLLQMGLKGSKILITTRIPQVVEAMAPASVPFEPMPLSEEDGWDLFRGHTFDGKSEDQLALDQVRNGKEIVKKCKGLPLLLKVLADDLRGADKKRWGHILNHETWEIKDNSGKNKVFEDLKLSYVRLPRRLRQCFLHCSVFPKDYEFSLKDLAQLWATHGLIETKESQQVNDIGEECIKSLLKGLFIQSFDRSVISPWARWEKIELKTFSLHDIMHDLAQYILEREQSLIKDRANTFELHRTLTAGTPQTLRSYHEPIVGRTFIYSWHPSEQGRTIDMLAQHLKYLRVLIINVDPLKKHQDEDWNLHVPNSIGDLKHLRYLFIGYPPLRRLPDSVCSLHNLQTLECPYVHKLPQGIRRLKRLQHLLVTMDKFPPGIGELIELQTLKNFYVIDGDDEWAHPSELDKLTRLGGESTTTSMGLWKLNCWACPGSPTSNN